MMKKKNAQWKFNQVIFCEKMAKDALETQLLVKNNCEDVTQQLKKLREWQKDIKKKEKSVKMNMDVSFIWG